MGFEYKIETYDTQRCNLDEKMLQYRYFTNVDNERFRFSRRDVAERNMADVEVTIEDNNSVCVVQYGDQTVGAYVLGRVVKDLLSLNDSVVVNEP